MGNRTIHLTRECDEIADNLKAKNPNFNLSKYIQDCLLKITQREATEETFINIINESTLIKTKAEQDIKRAEKLLQTFLERQKSITEQEGEKKAQEIRLKESGNYEIHQKLAKDRELRRSGEYIHA